MVEINGKNYSKEFKDQIIKECLESNEFGAVARKHDIPPTTVYTWMKRFKNQDKNEEIKNRQKLRKELEDAKLQIAILKELLKKTNQLWLQD